MFFPVLTTPVLIVKCFSPDAWRVLTTPVLNVSPLIEEFLPPVEWELIWVIHGDNALLVVVIMKFVLSHAPHLRNF